MRPVQSRFRLQMPIVQATNLRAYKTNDHRERIESAYRALHLGRHHNDYACNFKDIYPTSTFHAIETRTRALLRVA